jgi:hypothetical protein
LVEGGNKVSYENPKGLYNKYIIQKADGTPVDPIAEYFTLRMDTDLEGRKAIAFYAGLISGINCNFANETLSYLLKRTESGIEQSTLINAYKNGVNFNNVFSEVWKK